MMDVFRYAVMDAEGDPGEGITPALWSAQTDALDHYERSDNPDMITVVAFRAVDASPNDDLSWRVGYAVVQFLDNCDDGNYVRGMVCTDAEGATTEAEAANDGCPDGCPCWTAVSIWDAT